MYRLLAISLFVCFSTTIFSQQKHTIAGLKDSVEILIDEWGVPHIYAQNEADLFFAQGFHAAKDRLFQFEVWRRQATGTVAEILGARELKRDIGTRLFQFRGDIQAEMNHYHPRGELIITSFVKGVNAYIDLMRKNPELLPLEFELLGIQPQKWTPEIVISRHQGLLGNIQQELKIGRAVALLGADEVQEISWFHPKKPLLKLDSKIKSEWLFEDILELYNAYRRPVAFQPEDLISTVRNGSDYHDLAQLDEAAWQRVQKEEITNIGSNNWVVSGEHTQSGYPMMANDPHRSLASPSLRYMAHLVAPGWNVIGGGEPEIPGISIGHNEHGAWGLTVFRTDAEDLLLYETHPDRPNQYKYKGQWEQMLIIKDTIPVKGQQPEIVELKYTRHGPVVFENSKEQIAWAVRCGWLENGGSPYLASLRMNQAKNFEEFRAACNYSNIPGENMAWADKEGNIGLQVVGIAPIRRNWSGLVPVLGDGSYEWEGYLPIIAKPNIHNPESGMIVTANENITPTDYEYWDAIGYIWGDSYRGDRVAEMLASGKKHSLIDMANLQTDYLSIPARNLVPLLRALKSDDPKIEKARQVLLKWDFQMEANSTAASIYHAWEQELRSGMQDLVIPKEAEPYLSLQMTKIINWLVLPDSKFGKNSMKGRDNFLLMALEKAIAKLSKKLGTDTSRWQYGQLNYKHVYIKHPLSNAVKADMRKQLNVGPLPRGGSSFTVNNTSSNDNQSHGATFRIIVDTENWDHCLGTNAPGQNGNPKHPHYRNLFEIWANDQFFPLFFSREKVEGVVSERWVLEKK
ncbi:MAG: penicillin acylase family protein [Bacteroidota bacterium]